MKIEGIIIDPERADEKIIEQVKNAAGCICVYGCGNVGMMTCEYLERNGINVDFFVIDDEYYSFCEYKGRPVKRLSSIVQKDDNLRIFVGFANLKNSLEKLNNLLSGIQIYTISNPYLYLCENDIDADFYYKNENEFKESIQLFEDELSKKIFVAYLNTRINKNCKYMFPFGGCKTYFNNELFSLTDEEVYVDCGAYDGDSIKNFVSSVHNKYKKIYAIEPDKKNFADLEKNIKSEEIENVILINQGVWKEKTELAFADAEGQESSIFEKSSKNVITVNSLDNMLCETKPTLIKLSVQGAEEEALMGAKGILVNDEPKVACTIFMKPDALIKIPKVIKEINPRYKLYLRCEEAFFARVILYAKVER